MKRFFLAVTALLLVASCGETPEYKAFYQSMVRLRVATESGVRMDKFSDLVIDLQTNLSLAKKDMTSQQVKDAEATLSAAQDVKEIWSEELNDSDTLSPDLKAPLMRLRIIKGDSDFNLLAADCIATHLDQNPKAWAARYKIIIQQSLSAVHDKAAAAEKGMSRHN